MLSLCSECLFCKCSGGCLAGNGDDDFAPMDKAEIEQMIKSGYHVRWGKKITCRRCGHEWISRSKAAFRMAR